MSAKGFETWETTSTAPINNKSMGKRRQTVGPID